MLNSTKRGAALLLVLSSLVTGSENPSLSLDTYLHQVESKNPGYQGSYANSIAAEATAQQGSLLFAPQFFTDLRYIDDFRTTFIPTIEGTRDEKETASVGVRKQMDFGLQLSLSLDINHTILFGADPNIVTDASKTIISPTPLFNLSLWQNFGGKMDRANQALMEAQARATSYGSRYEAKATLVDAEGRYWRLAALREAIRVEKESAARAVAIRDLNSTKAERHLVDESDVLVARAAVQGKALELRSMEDEEHSAARSFNLARAIDSDEVGEALPLPDPAELSALKPPRRAEKRGDVLAAEQGTLAATAGNELARQKLLPSLNLYGSIYAVGVGFVLPLDFGTTSSLRDAYAQQSKAAELLYRRKLLDEEGEWKDLVRRFEEAKERLEIALTLEKIQKEKFESVRKLKKNGLTIEYQVFQYELDYLGSAMARVQIEGTILGLRAQMKLYEE